jgi:hypothetical protein
MGAWIASCLEKGVLKISVRALRSVACYRREKGFNATIRISRLRNLPKRTNLAGGIQGYPTECLFNLSQIVMGRKPGNA